MANFFNLFEFGGHRAGRGIRDPTAGGLRTHGLPRRLPHGRPVVSEGRRRMKIRSCRMGIQCPDGRDAFDAWHPLPSHSEA